MNRDDTLASMAASGLRVVRATPCPTVRVRLLQAFAKRPFGYLTALDDSLLATLRAELSESHGAEILPFGDLVRRMLILCGEAAGRLPSASHSLPAIALECQELGPESPLYAVRESAGLHRLIERLLRHLDHWDVRPDDLDAAAEILPARLAAKVRDLARIDRGRRTMFAAFNLETHADQLRRCLGQVPEFDAEPYRLLVFAGAEFSPLRARWLRWAASVGMDVTVVLDAHPAETSLFEGASRTLDMLGVEATAVVHENRLTAGLFAESRPELPCPEIDVLRAADALAECEWALRACQGSKRPAIYARSLDTYGPLLEATARRFGLRLRMPRREKLASNRLVRHVRTAFEFILQTDVRRIRQFFGSRLLGIDDEAARLLESAAQTAYASATDTWEAFERDTQSLADRLPWIPLLLAWRRDVQELALTPVEWARRSLDLVRTLGWHESAIGADPWLGERDRRALHRFEAIVAGFGSISQAKAMPEETLRAFVARLERLLADEDVSVPTEDDGIPVVDSAARLPMNDHLVAMGMVEGRLPRRRSEDALLADDERALLSQALELFPPLEDSRYESRAERDEFYRIVAAAEGRLTFTYPRTADDRADFARAFYLERVFEAAGQPLRETVRHGYDRTPLPSEIAFEADRRLYEALIKPSAPRIERRIRTPEAAVALQQTGEIPISVQALIHAFECPFRYQFGDRFRLHPARDRQAWYALRQLPQVAQIDRMENADDARAAAEHALESLLDDARPYAEAWEMDLLEFGGRRLVHGWIDTEFASRVHWARPHNLHFDLDIGAGKLPSPTPAPVRASAPVAWAGARGLRPDQRGGVGQMRYYRNQPLPRLKDWSVSDRFELGLYFRSFPEKVRAAGADLEVQVAHLEAGVLSVYLDRGAGAARTNRQHPRQGLTSVALPDSHGPLALQELEETWDQQIEMVITRVREGEVEPTPGPWCEHCDLGELCRVSSYLSAAEAEAER